MRKGEYEVQVAEDGLSVSFRRAICSRSFNCNKNILRKIMGVEYRKSSAHVIIAWDDTVLAMQQQNVRSLNGGSARALPPVSTSTITRRSTG